MTDVPEDAKQPEDHKPKQIAVDETLTATVDGMEITVPTDAMDDFELLDDIARLDGGDATRFPSILRRLIGNTQMRDVLDHLRDDETGRITVERGSEFVRDLLMELRPN
jgi:hypothetical protein